MVAFAHNDAHFTLQNMEGLKLANRVPAGEDTFLDRIAAASPYTSKLSSRELVSWFVARLNYLTAGEFQRAHSDAGGDNGGFLLPLVVVERTTRPSGIFWVEVFRDRLLLRGGRDAEARDPRKLFVQALVSEPDGIEPCRVRVENADAGTIWYCGAEAGQLIVG
ncbi:MAG: hypothetical protein JWN40_3207 [Phycisphaerales bacterium]|nr:hypothetical protein [Phycisphaerales bacterium]